jgi:hypothetical protein
MGLKESIDSKSKALVKRTTGTLPQCGESVVIRSLMTGELQRANSAPEADRGVVMICLCLEDPAEAGKPLLNVNDLNDRAVAAGLHIDDSTFVIDKLNELIGKGQSDAEILGNLARTENSSSSSPSATESSPTD